MKKEYLIKDDGWNKEAFECVLGTLSEISKVEYEIRNCVRTVEPTQMVELLQELTEALKSEVDYL